jgi:hypothetical protein
MQYKLLCKQIFVIAEIGTLKSVTLCKPRHHFWLFVVEIYIQKAGFLLLLDIAERVQVSNFEIQ